MAADTDRHLLFGLLALQDERHFPPVRLADDDGWN
jgi:hypothetical protein